MLRLLLAIFILSCSSTPTNLQVGANKTHSFKDSAIEPIQIKRDKVLLALQEKIKNKEPLIVHILVPLCDNDNQGIVPVNQSLGDGDNLKTNLYWGSLYGIKNHFKKTKGWKLKYNKTHPDSFLLERLAFERTYANGTKVILIADAYNGNAMVTCLNHYFESLANRRQDSILLDSNWLRISSQADLMVFNGHNGLMDEQVTIKSAKKGKTKDAVAIACVSKPYFKDFLMSAHAYPLVMTKHLLAPEAYVISGIIDAWALNKTEQQIHLAAATAYNKYQKCGMNGAINLFSTGW